jgi:parvulin-like peptidyl-prolyl isomerase
MSRRFIVFATAVIVSVTAAALARFASSAPPDRGAIVARVNAWPISDRDLAIRLAELLPMASFHGNIPPNKLIALRRTALDELVLDELIVEHARATGVTPDRGLVDRHFNAVRSRFASGKEFEDALRDSGLTPSTFRLHIERAVLVRQVQDVQVPPDPSEADAASYYGQHAAKFVRPEQVRLLVMTIPVDPAGGREAERGAAAKASSVMRRLRRGADFGQLAWDESSDAYRVKRGDAGWVHRGRLDPDLEAAAFAAPLGQFRTARSLSGFHVFTVVAREPERQLSFEEAQPVILERLRRDRRAAAEREWHDRLRVDARITILDPVLREARPVEIPKAGGPLAGMTSAGPIPVARPAR